MSSSDPTRVKSNYIPHILRFYGKSNAALAISLHISSDFTQGGTCKDTDCSTRFASNHLIISKIGHGDESCNTCNTTEYC